MEYPVQSRQKVKSPTTAQNELDHWVKMNRKVLKDQDGLEWTMRILQQIESTGQDSPHLRYYYQLESSYVAGQVLVSPEDARLQSLLRPDEVHTLKLRPEPLQATGRDSLEALQLEWAQLTLRLSQKLTQQSFQNLRKKQLITRIEQLSLKMQSI